MTKIDFKDIKVTDLYGNEISDFKAHEQVANILATRSTNNPVRNMELARKIFTDGEIDLLSEDVLIIKNAIQESKLITDLAKEPILKALE
jgi:hypothetical protein